MIFETSALSGVNLSYAVSLITNPEWREQDRLLNTIEYRDSGGPGEEPYHPHCMYEIGAKIIDEEHIGYLYHCGECIAFYMLDESNTENMDYEMSIEGKNMLEAGLRCFVLKHLGSKVEIAHHES